MIDLYWRGADGSLWDMIRGPVRITNDGLTGLLPGPTERRVTSSSKRDGQRRTGGRALPRPVVFPVLVHTKGDAAEWFDIYRAWTRSLSVKTPGQLIAANTATGQEASLSCAVETWPGDMPQDPSTTRRQKLVYGLIADDPFWYLPTFSQAFESASDVPVNYYGGGPLDEPGFGYPLVRGAGSQAGRVQLDNPGDQPAWWTARFPAPSTGFLVSINGATVAGSYAVPDGAALEVDAQAATVSVVAQGIREELPWYLLDRVEFAPLPPGDSAEVYVRGTGAGIPTFTFWPRRRDAL